MRWRLAVVCAVMLAGTVGHCGEKTGKGYWVKLVCESADKIATVRFGPNGATLEKTTDTRILKSDISGRMELRSRRTENIFL